MIRHLDLFSGIGGFALAVRWLGGETVGFCEIEPFPQRVLRKNFPGVPIHDDIRTLTGTIVQQWGGCDLITGGYPCQPFSVAGERRGKDDDRHLWPEMRRLIDECRPRFVLAENVYGHVSMGLDEVLSDLEAEGYEAGAVVVPACAVDAPHRRDRVWVIAHADSDSQSTLPLDGDHLSGELALAYSDSQRREWSGSAWEGRAGPKNSGGGEFRQEWQPEPAMGRVAHGIPRRVDRLKGLGNAIVPQVAYELLRVMVGV